MITQRRISSRNAAVMTVWQKKHEPELQQLQVNTSLHGRRSPIIPGVPFTYLILSSSPPDTGRSTSDLLLLTLRPKDYCVWNSVYSFDTETLLPNYISLLNFVPQQDQALPFKVKRFCVWNEKENVQLLTTLRNSIMTALCWRGKTAGTRWYS